MIIVSRRAMWVVLLSLALCVAMGMWSTGLSLGFTRHDAHILPLAIVPVIALGDRHIVGERARRLAAIIETIGIFSAIGAIGAMASYVVVAHNAGFTDDRLAGMDRAIGFDWLALYRFVADRPVLRSAERLAYLSIFVTPIVVFVALGWTGRIARARVFIAAFAFALVVTLIVFAFFPAKSALAHHVGAHPDYLPTTGIRHVEIITRLRAGTMTRLDPGELAGLITFPSVHTIAALMFIWAGWPVVRLRPALVGVNLAMLASIPIGGTHYAVDMIAGATIAAIAIAAAYWPMRNPVAVLPMAVFEKRAAQWRGTFAASVSREDPMPCCSSGLADRLDAGQ